MDADQVRAYVAAKWPVSMKSSLAVACKTFATADETSCAVELAQLQSRASESDRKRLRYEAMEHAEACLRACDDWEVETLGHNIESAFGADLSPDECDDIAREALRRW